MCVGIGAIGAVLGMAMSVAQAGAAQQAKQADYQAKAVAWQQNVLNSEAAARDEHRQILTRQMQEQDKTLQKDHISRIEQAQKGATAEVQAAKGGVSGISLSNIVDDINQKSLLNRTYADRNYMFIVADTQEQLKASDTRALSRINSVERPMEPANTFALDALGGVAQGIGKLSSSGVQFSGGM